jgi:hypothetical protein
MNSNELKIAVKADGTVEAEISAENAQDGKISTDELLIETLITFRDWLNQLKIAPGESDLILLGKLLYRLLFGPDSGDKIKDLVHRKLKPGRYSEQRLCVQLEFHESQSDLASLPWEFLYDPNSKQFFATHNDLVLARFVHGAGARQPLSSNSLPLQILVVVSKPPGEKSVAAQEVIEAIKEFADHNRDRITFEETDTLVNKNFIDLQQRLKQKEKQPQLVHFIGHGRYNKSKRRGEIALLNMKGDGPEWIGQDRFCRLFTDAGCVPRLLFLQLCEGAVVEQAELIASFEGLAPTLVSANVQAVVAMQFPIKNVYAGKISTKFYDELTKGKTVGEAVQEARCMILNWDAVASGTPVLYMYGYDGAIVSALPQSTGEGTAAGAYPGIAGTGTGDSRQQPTPGIAGETPTPPLVPRVATRGLPISLKEVLAAGSRKIKNLKLIEEQTFELNKRLFFSISPTLREKSVSEMLQQIAELCQLENDPQFKEVLVEMFAAAGRLS